MKNDNINKYEEFELEFTQTRFVKSYSMLTKLKITKSEKELIELVLSFTIDGKDFYMNQSDIADRLGVDIKSVTNMVWRLKKIKYISGKKKNFGVGRGSSTTLTVNDDVIISDLKKILELRKISTSIEGFKASTTTEKPIEPTTPIKDKPRLKVVKSEPIEVIETPQQVEPIEPVEIPSQIDMDKELSIEEIIMMCNIDKDKVTDRKHLTKRLNEFKTRELHGGGYLKLTPTNLIKTVLTGSEYRYYMHRFNDYINGRIAV